VKALEALLEVEELYMLYEDEVKHAELALEGLEEPSVSTVEAEKEAELTRIVGPEGSVDLVLVVEVSHWFDLENFYNNVRRVLCKSGGVIAVSVYPARPKEEPRVNKVLNEFCAAIERHWAPQVFRYVDPKPGYERLPFPFAQGNVTTVDANLEEFLEERALKVATEATEVIFEEELPSEVATGAPIEEAKAPEIAPEAL
jgi:SAM-dependent methyltransferase